MQRSPLRRLAMRIMCDTNVLVRAVLTPGGAASELLRLVAAEHVLITSAAQLSELLDVLRRPAIRALHQLDERGVRRFIARLYKASAVVPLPAEIPQIVARDPKDNPIVMTAVVGMASILCTLDRHLRTAAIADFCRPYGLEVITDRELLVRLRHSLE